MALDFVNQLKENLGKERDAELRAQKKRRPITIDHEEAQDNEIECWICGKFFKGGEPAFLVDDQTPTGQHAECAEHHAPVPAPVYKEGA